MKVTSIILLILGSIMVVFNLLGYVNPRLAPPDADPVGKVAYYIGYNSFFILGSILLIIGYSLWKKAKRKKIKKELMDNFLNDPTQKDQ